MYGTSDFIETNFARNDAAQVSAHSDDLVELGFYGQNRGYTTHIMTANAALKIGLELIAAAKAQGATIS